MGSSNQPKLLGTSQQAAADGHREVGREGQAAAQGAGDEPGLGTAEGIEAPAHRSIHLFIVGVFQQGGVDQPLDRGAVVGVDLAAGQAWAEGGGGFPGQGA